MTTGFARIGILAGGQLGRMMILAGTPLGFRFGVLTPNRDDPAASLADHLVLGTLEDRAAITELTDWADVTTYEIEHIDVPSLGAAEARGRVVLPRPSVLEIVNDKLVQKRVLHAAGVPVPGIAEQPAGYPTMQKLRRGGYDGRGVKVLRSPDEEPFAGLSFYEELVDFERELAVIVARSVTGEETTYPIVEMEFDPDANICSRVAMPARVPGTVAAEARRVAIDAVRAIGAVGIVAVELFLTRDGAVLVNELAPRPHNSGHLTIEASATSQFEQHLRAVAGLPLGDVSMRSPAVMVNMLGAPAASGVPVVPGLDALLRRPDVHVHWYGKRTVTPFRKMGHVTVLAATIDEAYALADAVEPFTTVEGGGDER